MHIDIHAHVLPEETARQLQAIHRADAPLIEHGADFDTLVVGPLRYPRFPRGGYDLPTRLEAMAASRVDAEAVSPLPQIFLYRLDPKIGLEFSQAQNEGLAQLAKQQPGRFFPLASVPLQDPEAAARELERAILELGLYGVETGTNVAGKNLDDPSLEPFFARLAELGCCWLIHPESVAALDRLGRYYLNNLIGNP